MDLTPLISSFSIVALAEFGDKTQLAAITLSTRYKPPYVFL
ncbi:MAG: TMEM165/GDT1 family protein, partial [archaeon]|nr:TMEM165/GDT1 family protein [archaeon]